MVDESKLPGKGTFTGTALEELRQALADREAEAAALRVAGHPTAALAQKVYALEIVVKILICEYLDLDHLPVACKTHDLSVLIVFTGRHRAIRSREDIDLVDNWLKLESFSKQRLNELRYQPASKIDEAEVALLIAAIDDPDHGVLAWLRKPQSS